MPILDIAHRGGAGLYPENTLAAFRDAVVRGCDGAELDVQLSKDGQVVVFHDFELKPEIVRLGGRWLKKPAPRIKELTLAELKAFDVGRMDPSSPYARSHPHTMPVDGETIPTLAEVVTATAAARKPFLLQVELKTAFYDRSRSADPVALAEAAVAVLRKADALERTIFVGFDWPALRHAKTIAPQTPCWFTTMEFDTFLTLPCDDDPPASKVLKHWAAAGTSPWAAGFDAVNHGGSIIRAIKAAGGDGWFPTYEDVTAERVAEARALGLKVGAWTVDEPAEMARLIGLGLDALCTDRPDLLSQALAEAQGGNT
jgi:glycerophosphoryl diester phosphodiesterase